MVLVIKAIVLLFGALAFQVYDGERVRTLTQLLTIWNRWDGGQYQMIAQKGYAAGGDQRLALAFFPLYPWLTRMTAVVVHDVMLSAFLVSTMASVALGATMARLFAIDYSRHLARRAVWFMFIFPTSYFLHIGSPKACSWRWSRLPSWPPGVNDGWPRAFLARWPSLLTTTVSC